MRQEVTLHAFLLMTGESSRPSLRQRRFLTLQIGSLVGDTTAPTPAILQRAGNSSD